MEAHIFLTGGTGFLGSGIAEQLLKSPDTTLTLIVHARDQEEAVHRLRCAWQHDAALTRSIGERVRTVPGDFTKPGLASIMIKLADEERGGTDGKTIDKGMTVTDHARMDRAVAQCREILTRLGVPEREQFLGTLNAGHPGGMLPLTAAEKDTLHAPALPGNLYVADATILPRAMGNPPILTIMALAKKIANLASGERF